MFFSSCRHVVIDGAEMLIKAPSLNFEGIMSKRVNSVYRSERWQGWVKTPCQYANLN